jgi:hypothetical protein
MKRALLMLHSCFTHALLMLYTCFTQVWDGEARTLNEAFELLEQREGARDQWCSLYLLLLVHKYK